MTKSDICTVCPITYLKETSQIKFITFSYAMSRISRETYNFKHIHHDSEQTLSNARLSKIWVVSFLDPLARKFSLDHQIGISH